MKIRKLALVLGLALTSTSLMAANNLKSSIVQLGGGKVSKNESLSIPTSKLISGVSYTVICHIKDPNNAKNKAMVKLDGFDTWSGVSVNGQYMWGVPQFELPSAVTEISLVGVSNYSPITVTNLDQDDDIEVTDCVAQPDSAMPLWNAKKK